MIVYTQDIKDEVLRLHAKGMGATEIYCNLKGERKPTLKTIRRWCYPEVVEKDKAWCKANRDKRRAADRAWHHRTYTPKDKAPPKPIHPCQCETPLMTRDLSGDEPTCLLCGRTASVEGRT